MKWSSSQNTDVSDLVSNLSYCTLSGGGEAEFQLCFIEFKTCEGTFQDPGEQFTCTVTRLVESDYTAQCSSTPLLYCV